jgi:hypothetical protein
LLVAVFTEREDTIRIVSARDGGITIPLKFFDEKLLRKLIRLHVAAEAFEKDAIKRMPGYHVRDAENGGIIRRVANERTRIRR